MPRLPDDERDWEEVVRDRETARAIPEHRLQTRYETRHDATYWHHDRP